jgi:oxygen-independent coproporphyrinogen-3 oxidase
MSARANIGSGYSDLVGRLVRCLTLHGAHSMEAVRGAEPPSARTALPDRLGLYVHVPFCERICSFCPYNKVLFEPGLAHRYERALRAELEMWRPSLKGRHVTSFYIGGGTPTLMPELVEELSGVARELGVRGEVGVEVLPNHASPEMLARLRSAGVTYVSLGVQSLHGDVLRALGRPHDETETRRALAATVAQGFDCLDVDLLFDVVRFGPERVLDDAREVFESGADQLSAYPMMRFRTTFPERARRHDEALEKRVLTGIERLGRERGYERSSVWTFNRDRSRRYTSITREFYVGLGPSASSFLDDSFAVNTFDTTAYTDLVESGLRPVVMRSNMRGRARMTYYLFWRFYDGIIDPRRFSDVFGVSLERAFPGLLLLFLGSGAMSRRGGRYVLNRRGFDLFHTIERWVTYNFIEPLWTACREQPFPGRIRM